MLRFLIRACVAVAALAVAVQQGSAQSLQRLITATDLATVRDIGGPSVSLDGGAVAFWVTQADPTRNSYDNAWHIVELATRADRRVADAGELHSSIFFGRIVEKTHPSPAVWSPDSTSIAYLRRYRNNAQIWRVGRKGGDAKQLTHNASDVREFVYARTGRELLFETEPSQAQIQAVLDAEGASGFRFDDRFEPMYSRLPTLPQDATFLNSSPSQVRSASERAARQIWVLDLLSGRERLASQTERDEFARLTTLRRPDDRPAFRGSVAQSPRGGRVWTEAFDPDRQGAYAPLRIVAQPAHSRKPIVCTAPECTGHFFSGLWWRGEDEIVFVRRSDTPLQDRELYAWRPSQPSTVRLILRTQSPLSGNKRSDRSCRMAPAGLVCGYEDAAHPRRLVALNLDNGSVETLFEPNPHFASFDLGAPPRRLAIQSSSGAETAGMLVLPPHFTPGERLPLIVVSYVCSGFLRGGVGDEYPIYPLAAQGFAVLCYQSPEYLERGERLDAAALNSWLRGPGHPERRGVEQTLDAAITQLDQMGLIDPQRVGVTGSSWGAEIVGFVMTQMPKLAAAISSAIPGTCASNYWLTSKASRDWRRSQGIGAPDETPARWRDIDFCAQANSIRAPLLMNVPDREMLAAVAPTAMLQQAGRVVEMYVFPDEYHVKWQPAHRLAIYQRNIDWMNFWLQGVEDPDPRKTDQYVRWRAFRQQDQNLIGSTTALNGQISTREN